MLDRAGVTGDDSASHNGMWVMATLQVVPGLRLAAPRDVTRLRELLDEAVQVDDAPTVVRFAKGRPPDDIPAVGKAGGADVLVHSGAHDALVVAVGSMGELAVDVVDRLTAQGIGVTVVDLRWVKPVDPAIVELARGHRLVVSIEDNGVVGGCGAVLLQALNGAGVTTPVRIHGIPQEFLGHPKRADILDRVGLFAQTVARTTVEDVSAVGDGRTLSTSTLPEVPATSGHRSLPGGTGPASPSSCGTPAASPQEDGTMDVRTKVSAALVVAAAVANGAESIGTRLLLPPKPEGTLEALQLVAAHRPTYAALATVGTLAVPLMAAAFWIMTSVARERTPRLGTAARTLLMAGMWGFLGMHVVLLTQVPLSATGRLEAGAATLEAIQGSALMGGLFLLPFLVGCTLGLLLLVVALFRSAIPRWIPLTMLAFLVVDFGLQNSGPFDAHWLWIAASIGLARVLVRPALPDAADMGSSPRVVVEA